MYNPYSTPPPGMGYPHGPFTIPLQDNRYYYDAFKRQLIMRFKLFQQLQIIKHEKDVCDAKLQFYQRKCQTAVDKQSVSQPFNTRIRRSRRTAVQIQRVYQCPHDKCSRSYGSQGSLQQHIKLKHAQQQLRSNRLLAQKYYPKQSNSGNYQAKINRLYKDLNNPNPQIQMRRNFNNNSNNNKGTYYQNQNQYWQKYSQTILSNNKKIRDQNNKDLQNLQIASDFVNKWKTMSTQTQLKANQKVIPISLLKSRQVQNPVLVLNNNQNSLSSSLQKLNKSQQISKKQNPNSTNSSNKVHQSDSKKNQVAN